MKKTKEIAEKTKCDLLNSGIKVFNEKGYMRTRLEDVAAAAGVTRGAIYHHFGNKAQLFQEILQSRIDHIVAVFEQILNEDENPLVSMKKAMVNIFIKTEQDEVLTDFAALLGKTEYIDELKDLRKFRDHSSHEERKILFNALENCKCRGLLRENVNIEIFSFMLIGAVDGIFKFWLQNRDKLSLKQNAEDIVEYLFRGVELE